MFSELDLENSGGNSINSRISVKSQTLKYENNSKQNLTTPILSSSATTTNNNNTIQPISTYITNIVQSLKDEDLIDTHECFLLFRYCITYLLSLLILLPLLL